MTSLRSATVVAAALVLAAIAGLPARSFAQSAPQAAPAGETVGGISCDAMEGQRLHIHQHLVIFDHGKQVAIPPNVGQPLTRRCIYWLHTHTPDGVIHIEAPSDRSFTLGDFFLVWGQPLGRTIAASAHAAKGAPLKVWVNGKPYAGDPRSIALKPHADIVIEAGPPFVTPPKFTDWQGR
ncbi:MAG: hypothetical protein ACHQSE_03165 [Gemmatimonadales bacterium]